MSIPLRRLAVLALSLCLSFAATAQVTAPAPMSIPPGFERQPLEPVGGEIARPAGWFIDAQEIPSGWSWVIAETDPGGGKPYLVGQKITLAMGIEATSGLTRAAFVAGFAEQKKREALEVYAECAVSDAGAFHRRCIEVRERVDMGGTPQEFRVVYTLLWGKELDWVVTSAFGAPVGQWERVQPASEAMATFRIFAGDTDALVRNAAHVTTLAPPATVPTDPVFNPIDEGVVETDPDATIKDAVGRHLAYRDVVRSDTHFVSAKPLAGGLPPVAIAPDGTRLTGTARLAYVIAQDGTAVAMCVVSTSDPRLEPTVLAAARAWKFEPATYDGAPVAALAVQDFDFQPDP